MNSELRELAASHHMDDPEYRSFRVRFALLCVEHIRELITDNDALKLLTCATALFSTGAPTRSAWQEMSAEAAVLASSHQGNSGSEALDGGGHAAVSATFALARALDGDAWHAAEYAAYAKVYAYSGHAVTDPDAFRAEYGWQVRTLKHQLSELP